MVSQVNNEDKHIIIDEDSITTIEKFFQYEQDYPGNDNKQSEEYYQIAHAYHTKDKNYVEAEKYYIKATLEDTFNPKPYYQLACIAALTDRPDPALRLLSIALKIDPTRRKQFVTDSDFLSIKNRSEFQKLVKKYQYNKADRLLLPADVLNKELYAPISDLTGMPIINSNEFNREQQTWQKNNTECNSQVNEKLLVLREDGKVEAFGSLKEDSYRSRITVLKSANWTTSSNGVNLSMTFESGMPVEEIKQVSSKKEVLTGIKDNEIYCGNLICYCLKN